MTTGEIAIGIDVGTQGTKAVAVDLPASRVVARASAGYGLLEGLAPGAAEQHPQTWLDAVRSVLAELRAKGVPLEGVAAVGISGQQHGLVLLDDAGAAVRPAKLWCDTATVAEARELAERFGAPVPVGFTASKIVWVQRHEPDNWRRTAAVMLPHDYVNFRLTGRPSMEVGDASGTAFLDIAARRFDERRVELIGGGLERRLPELIEAPARAGVVSREGAAWSGLAEGTVVAAGGGDNMMAAMGSGAIEPGPLVISLGTSATAFVHAEAPVIDPDGLIAPFCGSCGGWLPLLCTMNATGIVEEVRSCLGRRHEELTELARSIEPGSGGMLWMPFHMGERVPDLPEATGTITGLRPGWLDPGRLYRAALESVTAGLCWGIDRLRGLGVGVSGARLVGGGSKNPLWTQMIADMLAVPVAPLAEPESAALGAAIQAAWTAGDDHTAAGLMAIARPLTPLGEPVEPSDAAAAYALFRDRWAEALSRLYGVR